ncbi:hypothetical protein FHS10_002982 [Mucilaginibacter dorajii]|nr:hypothetical protein [Mucilaginibacter dorajii]
MLFATCFSIGLGVLNYKLINGMRFVLLNMKGWKRSWQNEF